MNRYRLITKHGMIPPKKFLYAEPAKDTPTVLTRPSNLQRMKDRLTAIKGVPKLAYIRKATE